MIVLHIKTEEDIVKHGNLLKIMKYINEGKSVYAFIFMDDCIHCIKAHPQWKLLESPKSNHPFHHDPNVVWVDINQALVKDKNAAKKLLGWDSIQGFPTVRLLRQNEKPVEFDSAKMGGITEQSLIHFLKDNSSRYKESKPHKQQGGNKKSNTTKKSKSNSTKKRKRTKKRKHSRRRKTRRAK